MNYEIIPLLTAEKVKNEQGQESRILSGPMGPVEAARAFLQEFNGNKNSQPKGLARVSITSDRQIHFLNDGGLPTEQDTLLVVDQIDDREYFLYLIIDIGTGCVPGFMFQAEDGKIIDVMGATPIYERIVRNSSKFEGYLTDDEAREIMEKALTTPGLIP